MTSEESPADSQATPQALEGPLADAERALKFSKLAGRDRQIPEGLLRRARELRRDQTSAEEFLWCCVRGRQLFGAKFRRQHNIGPFIADFYCHEFKLCVELDGGIHDTQEQSEKDAHRDLWFQESGFTLLRLRNEQVLAAPEEALAALAAALVGPHPPAPSPQGEGE